MEYHISIGTSCCQAHCFVRAMALALLVIICKLSFQWGNLYSTSIEEARMQAPCVLFIDEIDALAPSRNKGEISFHYKAEVNELLTQLDNKQNEGLIIIGATNFISNIDNAVLRPGRFDKKIFIGPPDLKARAEAFKMYLESYPQEKLRFDLIAELAENYTFAEIEFICNELKRDAIAQNRQLDTDYVCSAVNLYTPKLSDEAIESYF